MSVSRLDAVQPILPTTAVAVTLYGITLQDWLAILGIGVLILQGAYLLWKWRREARGK